MLFTEEELLKEDDDLLPKKKILVYKDRIQVVDPKIQAEINKINLSPSMIGAWLNSPADYIMGKFIEPLVIKKETEHLKRGNWFHSIMEIFFDLDNEKRTFDNLKKCVAKVSNEEEYKDFAKIKENQEWLKHALMGYKENWLEQAKDEKVATLFIMGEQKKGLELYVRGKIGDTTRTSLGFIDKIIETDKGLHIQDWKTGKKITDYNPEKEPSFNNPFDYWRQQTFYTMLLEQYGAHVNKASLIFPCAPEPKEVFVEANNEKIRKMVIADVEQVDKELSLAIMKDYTFPFKKGPYNGWASLLVGLGNAYKPEVYMDKLLDLIEIVE